MEPQIHITAKHTTVHIGCQNATLRVYQYNK